MSSVSRTLASVITFALTSFVVGALPASAVDAERISGNDAVATSIAISKRVFPGGAKTVYLTRSDVLADALSSGALTDGPILYLNANGKLHSSVAKEISRLNPNKVIAIGGKSAVTDAALKGAAGSIPTDRLAGSNRYETATLIAKRAYPKGSKTIYVANSINMADAIAGGILNDGPVLPLADTDQAIPAATKKFIANSKAENVIALGGNKAVSKKNLLAVAGNKASERIAGTDRSATSVLIAERAFPTTGVVYVADGINAAAALAAGSITDGPILLSVQSTLSPSATNYVGQSGATKAVAVGNTSQVSDALINQVGNINKKPEVETEVKNPAPAPKKTPVESDKAPAQTPVTPVQTYVPPAPVVPNNPSPVQPNPNNPSPTRAPRVPVSPVQTTPTNNPVAKTAPKTGSSGTKPNTPITQVPSEKNSIGAATGDNRVSMRSGIQSGFLGTMIINSNTATVGFSGGHALVNTNGSIQASGNGPTFNGQHQFTTSVVDEVTKGGSHPKSGTATRVIPVVINGESLNITETITFNITSQYSMAAGDGSYTVNYNLTPMTGAANVTASATGGISGSISYLATVTYTMPSGSTIASGTASGSASF